jgi:ribosomal protein S18 acetylase RimI-like enzyme
MLRNAIAADKAIVSEILMRSFRDNLSVNFIASEDGFERRCLALMKYSFEVCSFFGDVFLSDDCAGCALVLYPDKKRVTFRSVLLDLGLIVKCIGLSKLSTVIKRESQVAALHPSGLTAYLWYIGVEPGAQHQGIGSQLLDEVIAFCENQGRMVILETSTLKNIPWYEKFGFRIYEQLDLGYRLFFLKRDPLPAVQS